MNLHQKPTGVYYVIFRDSKGKQRWKSLGTKNKGEATRLYNHFKRAYLQGKLRKLEDSLSNITLQKFIDEFLNHIETTKENNTFDTYYFICKEIIFFFDKETLLKNINAKDIDSYIEYCKRVRKNKNITINKKLKHLKAIFNKAIEWEYIKKNPVTTKQQLKIDRESPRYLTIDEIEAMLTAIKDIEFKLFIYVALYTGCRRNEILNLKWEDIDFNKRTILIKKAKSHYSRYVPISDDLYNILYPIKKDMGKVFKWSPYTISEKFKKLTRKIGINCRLHDLRHSFATHLLNSCGNIKIVQDVLGHRSIQSTMVYVHSMSELNRNAINKLNFYKQQDC